MFRFLRRRERAQVLMFVALAAPIMLGMTGMAIDIGSYAGHKRHLQNAADGAALAAAQDLCKVTCSDTSAATAAGRAWATKNNISLSDLTLTFSGGSTTPTVRAVIQTNHKFAFMKIVGINSKGVGAAAAAEKTSVGGSAGIVPWAITQATVDGAHALGNGALITLKYDTTGSNTGNFGAIQIDGPGSSTYGDSVMHGSQDYACAASAPNCTSGACPGTYPATCAENSPSCDGPVCDPKTGNVIGDTRTGVDFRMNNTSAACNTFDKTFQTLSTYRQAGATSELMAAINELPSGGGKLFSPPGNPKPTDTPTSTPVPTNTPTNTPLPTNTPVPATATPTNTLVPTSTNTAGPSPTPTSTNTPGPSPTPTSTGGGGGSSSTYRLNPDCNPWTDGPGHCANNNAGTLCSRRVIIIPVVDQFGNGTSSSPTILRFALLYLEGYDAGKCGGSFCDINGRFVDANVNMNALAGTYDPTASIHFTRLVE